MIQIIVWPTLCVVSKLRSIIREIIRVRTDNAILREQTQLSEEANEIEEVFSYIKQCNNQ